MLGSEACIDGVCQPEVRIATSVENRGGTSVGSGPSVPYATFLDVTKIAFQRWTSAKVSTCQTFYRVTFAANFSTPDGPSAISSGDGRNSVLVQEGDWTKSDSVLGVTNVAYYPSGTNAGRIIDADMEINGNVPWATDGNADAYDLASIVIHEAGHFAGLGHTTTVTDRIMFPTVSKGVQHQVPKADDEVEICTLYPVGTRRIGSLCNTASACDSSQVCEGPSTDGGSPDESSSSGSEAHICTQDCTGPLDKCSTPGYSCQLSNNGYACLVGRSANDSCKFCAQGSDCQGGVCLKNTRTGASFCSQACVTDLQCQKGSACFAIGGGSATTESKTGYCIPSDTCSNQCTQDSSCPLGYTCANGHCTPRGNVGDRCEISMSCQNCLSCTNLGGGIAQCLTCCGGTGDNCSNCGAASCDGSSPSGAQCVAAMPITASGSAGASTGDQVCATTTTAPGACEKCTSACKQGFTCDNGTCRAPCNPTSPGKCQTCVATSSDPHSGYCACSGEFSLVGEECFVAAECGPNATCVVGTPKNTCRAKCDATQDDQCPVGYRCASNADRTAAVCLPIQSVPSSSGGGNDGAGSGSVWGCQSVTGAPPGTGTGGGTSGGSGANPPGGCGCTSVPNSAGLAMVGWVALLVSRRRNSLKA